MKKRIFDIVFSLVFIVLCLPLMFLIAFCILIFYGRPIIFKQERVGIHEQTFIIYKFRTMINGSGNKAVKTKTDPRVTKLGYWLRHYKLDELPQFFNVLKGNMGLVGPRPHTIITNKKFKKELPDYLIHYRALPGITGLSQIHIDSFDYDGWGEKAIKYDLEYINQMSIWLDIKIILRTILFIVTK